MSHQNRILYPIIGVLSGIVVALVVFLIVKDNNGETDSITMEQKTEKPKRNRPHTDAKVERVIARDGSMQKIKGQTYYFYNGQLYEGKQVWAVDVAFIRSDDGIDKAILHDTKYGVDYELDCTYSGNSITMKANNVDDPFTISLNPNPEERLVGSLRTNGKKLTLRLMPGKKNIDLDATPYTTNVY